MSDPDDVQLLDITRRQVLQVGTIATASGLLLVVTQAQVQGPSAQPSPENGWAVQISFQINGRPQTIDIDARASLLDMLRERLGLVGAKKGCDNGQCGACTVHVNGRRVVSCLTLAAKLHGRDVTTIGGRHVEDAPVRGERGVLVTIRA